MPRDGTKNLISNDKRTPEEVKKNASKGGIASGKARREKRDLRKALQMALNNNYTDSDGNSISAIDAMARNLVAKAVSKNNKDAMQAIKYICELTGMNKTPEQQQKDKVELKLLEQELKLKEQVTKEMQDGADNEIHIEIVRAQKKKDDEGNK